MWRTNRMQVGVVCIAALAMVSRTALAEGLGAEVEVSVWQSAGQAGFQIGNPLWVISELEYPMDGVLAEVRASVPLVNRDAWAIKVRGRYATQLSYDGTSKDSDFLDIPGVRSDYSESDSKADVSMWDADAVALWRPMAGDGSDLANSIEVGLFAGYMSQTFDYKDNNLEWWYNYGTDHGTYRGAVSTYGFEFTGARAGLCASVKPVSSLKITAEAALIPDLKAKGDGDWLLRMYPFSQSADGDGLMWNVKVTWQIIEQVGVFAAYRSVELIADKNGVESGHEAGQPSYSNAPIVPQITAEYTGIECGLTVSF